MSYLQAIVFICGIYQHPTCGTYGHPSCDGASEYAQAKHVGHGDFSRCVPDVTECVEQNGRNRQAIDTCWFRKYGPMMSREARQYLDRSCPDGGGCK